MAKKKKDKEVKSAKATLVMTKQEGDKTLKVGKKVLISSPTLTDLTEVVEVYKKTNTAKLANGVLVSLYYKKDKELKPINSNVHNQVILVMGSKAKKLIFDYNLSIELGRLSNILNSITKEDIHTWDEINAQDTLVLVENLKKALLSLPRYNELPF